MRERSHSAMTWAAAVSFCVLTSACGDDGGGDSATGAGASGAAPTGGTGASTGGSGATGGAGAGGTGGAADGGSGGVAGSGEGGDGQGGEGGAGLPLDGYGDIAGRCGVLDPAVFTSSSPGWVENVIAFPATAYDYAELSAGGQKIVDDGNLGGSSINSEIFSYEVLYRCELATLLETEAGIDYENTMGKKTDLLMEIDGLTIGVSVTRAFVFPPGATYTVAHATTLLEGKLDDILLSTANVSPNHAWEKQILHVLAYSPDHLTSLQTAYAGLDAETKADTIVVVTVTDGTDDFIYLE